LSIIRDDITQTHNEDYDLLELDCWMILTGWIPGAVVVERVRSFITSYWWICYINRAAFSSPVYDVTYRCSESGDVSSVL